MATPGKRVRMDLRDPDGQAFDGAREDLFRRLSSPRVPDAAKVEFLNRLMAGCAQEGDVFKQLAIGATVPSPAGVRQLAVEREPNGKLAVKGYDRDGNSILLVISQNRLPSRLDKGNYLVLDYLLRSPDGIFRDLKVLRDAGPTKKEIEKMAEAGNEQKKAPAQAARMTRVNY